MNERQAFGALIRKWRESQGVNADVLASRLGLGASTYSNVETGKRQSMPEPELVRQLHKELGVPKVDMLIALGYLDPEPPGDEVCVPADSLRAKLLKTVGDLSEQELVRILLIVEAAIDYRRMLT